MMGSMSSRGWTALGALVVATVCAGGARTAAAQTVTVQGQVQVGGTGYGQPPPGYGQGSGVVYVQPGYPQTQPYPQPQPYQQPQYRPQRQVRYEESTRNIPGLWIPGMIMFGVSYGLGAISSHLTYGGSYPDWMTVPLVGPWVALAAASNEDQAVGAIVSGTVQAVGLGMFILGLSIQRTVRVARYALDDTERSPELAFELLPAAGGARLGVSLTHF